MAPPAWPAASTSGSGSAPPSARRSSSAGQQQGADENGGYGSEEDDLSVTDGEGGEDGVEGGAAAGAEGDKDKKKTTRGSRACLVCRRLKMRCVGAEEGPPCKRCKAGGHECIFNESQRGKRSNRKTDQMAKSLKQMEETLQNVLQSIGGAAAQGLIGAFPAFARSPSAHDNQPQPGQPLHPTDTTMSTPTSGSGSIAPLATTVPAPAAIPGLPPYSSSLPHRLPNVLLGHERPSPASGVRFDLPATDSAAPRNSTEWSGVRGGASQGPSSSPADERLHSLPDNTLNPLGLLAEASLQNTRKRAVTVSEALESADGDVDEEGRDKKKSKLGLSNAGYFQPGPMNILPLRRIVIEQRMPPALLVENILSIDEVIELFAIFFEHCHRQSPFLDPDIHTPAAVGSRSPFLFTCICTVASRYYTKRTDDLYRKCLRVAKRVAFETMSRGFKSVEICQAFLLLTTWNQPAERFEEERTYAFSGIAIRMATDLNLHRKTTTTLPPDATDEMKTLYHREVMNRERTWLFCYIIDRSVATQMGKPAMIAKEDFILRNAKVWFTQPGAQLTDSGLSALVQMHRIVGRILDTLYSDTSSVSGLNPNLDYPLLIRSFLGQLDTWRRDWTIVSTEDDEWAITRNHQRDFYYHYYRLFLLSFAIQHALDTPEGQLELPSWSSLCFASANALISVARDYLGPKGILRFGMDSTFVYLSYAATFLLKLVSPAFAAVLDEGTILKLVTDVAETLERCAVDDTHTPALYASFLRALIDNKKTGVLPGSRAVSRLGSPVPNGAGAAGAGAPAAPAPGMDAFLRSRAGSLGPIGEEATGGAEDGEGGAGANGAGLGGHPLSDAFDPQAMDSLLAGGDFWSNMLMPGFGGPLAGLSGGSGTMLGNPADPWSATPLHSRPGSPSGFHGGGGLGGFDFGV